MTNDGREPGPGPEVTLLLTFATMLASVASAAECDPRIVNRRDGAFTVVWGSSLPETGYVRVTAPLGGVTEVCDVRDGGAGCPGVYGTHVITVTGLDPTTPYVVQRFANGVPVGPPLNAPTGPTLAPRTPDTAFGRLLLSDGVTHATGAYVCATIQDANGTGTTGGSTSECDLIEAATDLGYWAVNLGDTRTPDLTALFVYSTFSGDDLVLEACGGPEGVVSSTVDTADDSPAADLVLVEVPEVPAAGAALLAVLVGLMAVGLGLRSRGEP